VPAVITPVKPETATPKAPPERHGVKHLLLESIVALVCVIAIVEGLFAMAGVGEQEYLRVDRTLGFVPMEGKHVTWRKEGCGHIQFNSQGRNDIERPFAKPANTFRIAIVGDSFVESLQVDRNQNFCSLLSDDLNAKYGQKRKIEVLNFGCSANNLGQFYKKMNTQVFRYQPDVVLIGISVDATKLLAPLQGGFAFANARPTFLLDKQGKLVEDWQVFNWWNHSPDGKRFANTAWLRQYSHIWGAIGTMMGSYSTWCQELAEGKVWGWGQAAQAPAQTAALPVKKAAPKAGDFSAINSSCGGSGGAVGKDSAEKNASAKAASDKADQDKAAQDKVDRDKAGGDKVGAVKLAGENTAGENTAGENTAGVARTSPDASSAKIALPQAQGDVEQATKQYWPVAATLIEAMSTDCKKHGCKFGVVHLPARPEIGYDNPRETKNLEELTTKLSIPYVDLTPAFLSAPKETALIYTVHMTPAGHQLTYKIFSDFIVRNHLI
jgi:hypothetical protein